MVLRRLRIENLVLIRDAELVFASGLNAITGETGAGKTILAQAVGLLLGAKGESGFIGADGDEAYVEAELDLPAALLEEDGLESLAELRPEDEDGLVLARRIFGDGRTRAYAWGRSAAREDIAAAADRLIAMSGQFEQRRLARAAYQLEVLDAFSGVAPTPASRGESSSPLGGGTTSSRRAPKPRRHASPSCARSSMTPMGSRRTTRTSFAPSASGSATSPSWHRLRARPSPHSIPKTATVPLR
jgi:AAA domain